MKGLLLKDYYVIRDTLFIQLVMLSVIGIAWLRQAPSIFIIISTVVFSLFSSTCIVSDRASKWDMFAATIPISNTKVIRSKYILNILLVAMGLILGILLTFLVSIISGELEIELIVRSILIAIALSLSSASVSIPLSILFDDKKQILVMVFSVMIPTAVFVGAIFVASKFIELQENMMILFYPMFGIALIMFITSWLVAPKLLRNRKS